MANEETRMTETARELLERALGLAPDDRALLAAEILASLGARRGSAVCVPEAQDEHSGVSAFFGTWPGDETDAELLKALRAID